MTALIGGLLLNLTAWLIFVFGLDFDKTALILHYNSFLGIDRIAINSEERHFLDVFFVPFWGLSVMIINYLLGLFLIFSKSSNSVVKKEDKVDFGKMPLATLGGYILFGAGFILQVTVIVYSLAIFFVNS